MMSNSNFVRNIADRVGEVLADERLSRSDGFSDASGSEQLLARETARAEVARALALAPSDAWPPLDEESLVEEVIALVLGLGRLETLLNDPDVSDIHVRGADSV